jgi:hypothetical protein
MPSKTSDRRRSRDTRRAQEHDRERSRIETRNDEPRVRPEPTEPTIPQFRGPCIRALLQDKIDAKLWEYERAAYGRTRVIY